MDNSTSRIIGGIYIALCNALSPEGVEIACDTLRGFADNPGIRPEDRRVYGLIAETANRDIEYLEKLAAHIVNPEWPRLQ